MSEVERSYSCRILEVLTFSGSRRVAMKNTWQRAHQMKEKGEPLTNENFKRFLKEEWRKVKHELIPQAQAEYKACKRRFETKETPKKVRAEARIALMGQEKE